MAQKPRNIFEDVGTTEKIAAAPTGTIGRASQGARGAIRVWLMVIFAMVALIIAVGGMTRLTDSGLSITEWAPIEGAIPPLSAGAWDAEFEAYRDSPEYLLQNAGMTLEEFKYIYWWEWGHRQLARAIGLVWALGFVYFWATSKIPNGWRGRLFGVGVLIGVQGGVGWLMVNSGLQDGQTDVKSYWLAAHLGMAFITFAVIAWFILLLGRTEGELIKARRSSDAKLFSMGTGLMHLTFVQILLGALVAGIDAGRAFPTWPLMGDGFFPPDPFQIEPLWRNFFEDAGLVQFIHRMAGYVLMIFAVVVWLRSRKSARSATRFAFAAVLAGVFLQMVLGIFTALYSAPIQIAIVHQFGAVIVWVLVLRARYLARYPLAQSLRGDAA